jgi:hypothetical protein
MRLACGTTTTQAAPTGRTSRAGPPTVPWPRSRRVFGLCRWCSTTCISNRASSRRNRRSCRLRAAAASSWGLAAATGLDRSRRGAGRFPPPASGSSGSSKRFARSGSCGPANRSTSMAGTSSCRVRSAPRRRRRSRPSSSASGGHCRRWRPHPPSPTRSTSTMTPPSSRPRHATDATADLRQPRWPGHAQAHRHARCRAPRSVPGPRLTRQPRRRTLPIPNRAG